MSAESGKLNSPSFWERQFEGESTPAQDQFDLWIGIALPLLCLLFDPIVFREGSMGGPILTAFAAACWTFMAVGVLTLFSLKFLRSGHAVLSGILTGTMVYTLFLGAVLLPLSLIGLLFGIGLLGFSPFLVAFVLYRNAKRQWQISKTQAKQRQGLSFAIGLVAALLLPKLSQTMVDSRISSALLELQSPAPEQRARGASQYFRFRWFAGTEPLIRLYQSDHPEPIRLEAEQLFHRMTGDDIDTVIMLRDED